MATLAIVACKGLSVLHLDTVAPVVGLANVVASAVLPAEEVAQAAALVAVGNVGELAKVVVVAVVGPAVELGGPGDVDLAGVGAARVVVVVDLHLLRGGSGGGKGREEGGS